MWLAALAQAPKVAPAPVVKAVPAPAVLAESGFQAPAPVVVSPTPMGLCALLRLFENCNRSKDPERAAQPYAHAPNQRTARVGNLPGSGPRPRVYDDSHILGFPFA